MAEQELCDEAQFLDLLKAEVKTWQRRLRLRDWTIEVCIRRYSDMPDDAIATIETFDERKDARISVLAPCDLPLLKDRFFGSEASNYSLSIVHELLHLHLLPLSSYEDQSRRIAEEQAINAISRALIAAYTPTAKPVVPPTQAHDAGHYM